MEDGLGQFNVSKVARTFGHVASTGLTFGHAVDDTLTRVHEAAKFGPAALIDFRKLDAAISRHGHAPDFFGAQDAKLDFLDTAQRRFGIVCVDARHDADDLGLH